MKKLNLKVFEKDRNNISIDNKIKILMNLGYDLSKNRKQGKMVVSYDILFDKFECNYITYNDTDIKKGKIDKGKFFIPININTAIKHHYNCQLKKNKNRRLRRLIPCIDDNSILTSLNKIDKIHAVSRHPNTSVVAFDIDNHNSTPEKSLESFKFIVNKYYNNIIYTEMSHDLGFHIFINFNKKMTLEKLNDLQEQINSTEHKNIEIIKGNKILRFIDSPHYIPIKFNKTLTKVKELSEKEYTNQILNFKFETKQAIYKKTKIEIKEKVTPIFCRNNNNIRKNHYRTKSEIINELNHKFQFGAGQRFEHMFKIASACLYYNLNSSDFISITLSNNKGSKDLAKWSYTQIERIYTKFYETFCLKLSENKLKQQDKKNSTFISNIELLNNSSEFNSQIIIEKFINSFISNEILPLCKYKKWRDEYKRSSEILIKEIIGYMIYNEKNKKIKNSNSILSDLKFKKVNKGFQFNRNYLNHLKKYYNIKINIHNLFNIIIKNSIFDQIFHNQSGYCFNNNYKFSRQFKLSVNIRKYNSILYKIIRNIIYYLKENINSILSINKIKNNMLKVLFNENYDFDNFLIGFT